MRRLHPATMIVAFLPALKNAASSLLPFLAVSIFSGKGDMSEVIMAGIGVLGGFGAVSTFLTTRYWIEDNHLKSTTGWLFKRDRQIPLEHIQNVNLRQNLLERTFRVLTVEVETAAGTTPELKLQVVTAADAEQLRGELLAARKPDDPALAPAADEPIYRVPPADLWLGAITENHFGHLFAAVLPFFGIGAIQSISGFAVARNMVSDSTLVLLAIAAGLFFAGAGWVVGAIGYALKYARFQVLAEPGAYRISYGFLTRVQVSIRAKRIEHVEASATLWQKWIRRTAVHVGTAGTFGEQGMTAPIALMLPEAHRDPTLQSLLAGSRFEDLEWKRFPRFYLFVSTLRATFGVALVAAPVFAIVRSVSLYGPAKAQIIVSVFNPVLALSILGLAFGILENFLSFRVSGYAKGEDLIAVRHGFFRRRTTFMPLDRAEVIECVQPIFWRKRRLATLTVVGMKHRLAIPMLPMESAEALVEQLRRRSGARQLTRSAPPNQATSSAAT